MLPTFSSVAATFHMTAPPEVKFPGIDIELSKVLHGSESVTVSGPRRQADPHAPSHVSPRYGIRARPP